MLGVREATIIAIMDVSLVCVLSDVWVAFEPLFAGSANNWNRHCSLGLVMKLRNTHGGEGSIQNGCLVN